MLTSRNLSNVNDIVQWTARLDRERPERAEIIRHIVDQVGALPFPTPHVVELCFGAGRLAEALLTALPQIHYTGFDRSELMAAYNRDRLAVFGERATFLQTNLNEEAWLAQTPRPVHAIVSMQSLHDLGGEAEVDRIYGVSKGLLAPGGLFLNADLVVPPGQDKPDNPGRRSIPRHLELLQQHGYERVACSLAQGEFGCFVAFNDV